MGKNSNKKMLLMLRWVRENRPDVVKQINDYCDKEFPNPPRKLKKVKTPLPPSLKKIF